jgi:hypothetical protein
MAPLDYQVCMVLNAVCIRSMMSYLYHTAPLPTKWGPQASCCTERSKLERHVEV